MPVSALNITPTEDDYTEALTVQFGYPRRSFSVAIANEPVYYRVAIVPLNGRDMVFEGGEHYAPPAFLGFRDAESEGFPPKSVFAGIQFRSAVEGRPAIVTVQ